MGVFPFLFMLVIFLKLHFFSRKARGDEERMLALFFDRVCSVSSPSAIFGLGRISKSGYMTLQVSSIM
jgi:hypothetical protein